MATRIRDLPVGRVSLKIRARLTAEPDLLQRHPLAEARKPLSLYRAAGVRSRRLDDRGELSRCDS